MATARWHPSPNCDARPDAELPELLVLHNISLPAGCYGGPHIDELFCNELDTRAHETFFELEGLRVSAHLLIRRNGVIVQYVSLNDRAWHAGPSVFEGRKACNDFSIGIELEGSDDVAYTPAQYNALAPLYVDLTRAYPALAANPVVGHSDIAPQRKTDPGSAFDWDRLERDVQSHGGTIRLLDSAQGPLL